MKAAPYRSAAGSNTPSLNFQRPDGLLRAAPWAQEELKRSTLSEVVHTRSRLKGTQIVTPIAVDGACHESNTAMLVVSLSRAVSPIALLFSSGNVSLGLLARTVSAGGRSQLRAATAGTTAKSGLPTPAGVVASFRTRLQLAKHVIKTPRPAQRGRARTSSTGGGDAESEIRPSMSMCSGQL